MRRIAMILAVCLTASAPNYAQTGDIGNALRPDPVSVIITIIPWLLKEGEQYYFVTARGYGRTTEEARTQALRAAVDQAVGSVINSEREVENQRLKRSEVVQYAAGFVDKYEVKDIQNKNGLVEMTVDVYVKRSRLSDRLLGDHKTPGKIDGVRIQAQTETLDHSRQQGDRLLQMVLADFPKRAYEIEQRPTKIFYDANRSRMMELHFVIRWRYAYVESLRETLGAVSQNANAGDCIGLYARQCQYRGYVTIKARPGTHGWSRTAAFDDAATLALVEQNLINSRPTVLITLFNSQGNTVWKRCVKYSDLDNSFEGQLANDRLVQPTDRGVLINTWINWAAIAPFNLDQYGFTDLDRYEIAVVRRSECPN